MRNKSVFVAAIALMATGMIFACTLGDLPGLREGEKQSVVALRVDSITKLSGVVGMLETPNTGISLAGERPATGGTQYGQWGSASPNNGSLPGTATNTALLT